MLFPKQISFNKAYSKQKFTTEIVVFYKVSVLGIKHITLMPGVCLKYCWIHFESFGQKYNSKFATLYSVVWRFV